MSKRSIRQLDVVPNKDAEPGSPEWVEYVAGLASSTARDVTAKCGDLQKLLATMRERDAHKAAGFVSFEAFVHKRVGLSPDHVQAVLGAKPSVKVAAVLRRVGRPKAGEGKGADCTISRSNQSPAYLAARLRRDHPDAVFDESVRGSVRQAAIAAGIVKVPTVLEQLRKLWAKASDADRRSFMEGIGHGR